ncbi:hypothetical protein [Streptococcus acidominimus]|uniref:Uncharacterized protein n=1 Tax=Streptococcus acidominimus TaxID=1326 RepID=A0A380ID40_STRAI|nr:hypothetical protein [Streptococcus acidominimus]SUN06325.1 Uncharacterised protein [Streptococcus acidominimus]
MDDSILWKSENGLWVVTAPKAVISVEGLVLKNGMTQEETKAAKVEVFDEFLGIA